MDRVVVVVRGKEWFFHSFDISKEDILVSILLLFIGLNLFLA